MRAGQAARPPLGLTGCCRSFSRGLSSLARRPPKLPARIEFRGVTEDGMLRHPGKEPAEISVAKAPDSSTALLAYGAGGALRPRTRQERDGTHRDFGLPMPSVS